MTTRKATSTAPHQQQNVPNQRRGKREATAVGTKQPLTVQEQLNNAEATVAKALAQGHALQQSWRKHLWHLSLLLIILSFHQAQGPIGTCLENVKLYNNNNNNIRGEDHSDISFGTALKYLAQDSLCNILAIAVAGILSYFIIAVDPPGDFSHVSFKAATALLPAILSLYFQQQQGAASGCCIDAIVSNAAEFVPVPVKRTFPVVIVFHVIVIACFSFMSAQISYQEKNYEAVRQMRRELELASNKNKEGTATKTNKKKK